MATRASSTRCCGWATPSLGAGSGIEVGSLRQHVLAQTNAFKPNSNAVSGAPSDCVLHKSLAAGCLKLGDRYDAVPVGVDLSEVYDVRRGVSLSQRVAAWHRLLPYL